MFDDEVIDVLIGGYMSRQAAAQDYEAVLACGGYLHGAVVVSKDLEGNLSVEQTDHMVREGAAGLGAVGFAVGLFAPPLLAATAVGAALGGAGGKLLHHRTAGKLEEQAGEAIPIGGAGLIVAYPHSAAAKVEPAVTRALQKVVGEAEGHHVQALKAAITDAQEKMAAGNTWPLAPRRVRGAEPGGHRNMSGASALGRVHRVDALPNGLRERHVTALRGDLS